MLCNWRRWNTSGGNSMTQPSNYDLLSQYFGGPAKSLGPGSAEVAKLILLNAKRGKPVGPGGIKQKASSVMGKIFDVLSRGNYASAEYFRNLVATGDASSEDFWAGLSGDKKTTFKDVLKEAGVENPRIRAAVGLGLDIFADPTTYIPVGGAISKVKALKGGTKVAEELPLGQRLLDRGDPIYPEAFGLPERVAQPQVPASLSGTTPPRLTTSRLPISRVRQESGFTVPQDTLPGFKTKINIPPSIREQLDAPKQVAKASKEVKGQQPFKFPDFSVNQIRKAETAASATKIIDDIAKGNPEAIRKVTPTESKISIEPRHEKLADEILSKWDGSRATAEINKKFPDTLNAKQQAKLYYQAVELAKRGFTHPNSSVNVPRIHSTASKIYIAMERKLESQGLVPRIGTGENVKLSDVLTGMGKDPRIISQAISEFASEIKPGSPLSQIVEGLRAKNAINDAQSVKLISEKVQQSKAVNTALSSLSDPEVKKFDDFLKQFSKKAAKNSTMSPAGINTTNKIIDDVLRYSKTPAQHAFDSNTRIINDLLLGGKDYQKLNGVLTRALEKDLGKLPTWTVHNNNAAEWFMGRVASWWGQKDLRPMSLNAIGSSAATAATRGKVLDNLFEGFGLAERNEAFRVAQGSVLQATTKEVQALSAEIARLMDNLVGQVTGRSVLTRSGVDFDLLNKWMKQYKVGFEFTKGKVTTPTGQVADYSKGTDWVNSWKTADIKDDPKAFVFKIQQAMEQATREKALFEEIGERFGSTVSGKGFRTKVEGYPYLNGYYFTDDISKQIARVVRDWSLPSAHYDSGLIQLYDRVLSMWKSGVTIYRPGHHVRNMVGDVYLGWMDGVNTLRPYTLAAQVQRSMQGVYKDLRNVDDMVRLGALPRSMGTPKPNKVLFKNKTGTPFTAEQIGAVAYQKGLLEHAQTLEDIIDMGSSTSRNILDFKPFGGRVQQVARGASELQSHNARLAHFIDKIQKSRGDNIEDIFEKASQRARKWHPSGLDLTYFEKKYLRRVMPFYSWMRKSLPLLLEGMVMNPGKVVIPAKVFDAIQAAQGIETPGRHDPFPVDQMFPDWIKAGGIGPVDLPEGILSGITNQSPAGYSMAGMGLNPLSELITQLQDPGRTLSSSLTPGLKIPMELMMGREAFTQEPITGSEARPGAFGEYVGSQIPGVSALQGITGYTPFGDETKRSGDANAQSLANFLTGLGFQGTGPYVRQARYETTQPYRQQNKLTKEEFLKQLEERLGN
jgi:hypothetical protein